MKRKICKILIGIGIFFIMLDIFIMIKGGSVGASGIAFWMFIIAWWGWNSEERKKRKKRIFEAQIKSLEKGNVNFKIKGKMRKLK